MTEVSVRVDVLKGVFKITPDLSVEDGYVVDNSKYHPLRIKAGSLGQSVDYFLQSVHLLKPTQEYLDKQQTRSALAKAMWEKRNKDKAKQNNASAGNKQKTS